MDFKPAKLKVIVSIVILIVWYALLIWFASFFSCNYYQCPAAFKTSDCEKVFVFNILPELSCGGCVCPKSSSLSEIFTQLIILLSPAILVYLIWSLIEKKK